MILALDLGTNLGFAYGKKEIIKSGSINLKKLALKDQPVPFLIFSALDHIVKDFKPNLIVAEIIRCHGSNGLKTAHFYGALLFCLKEWCYQNDVTLKFAEVMSIKKIFTGNGKASKDMMKKYAQKLGYHTNSYDEADAIAIWTLATCHSDMLKQ